MSTQNQYLVTVTVDGKPHGVWDKRSGGEVSAEVSKRRVGGGIVKTYPNKSATAGDVTVNRVFERVRDYDAARRELEPRAGLASMTVTEQPLDADGVAWGEPKVWTGVLQSVDTGESDSDSPDLREITLVMVSEGVA